MDVAYCPSGGEWMSHDVLRAGIECLHDVLRAGNGCHMISEGQGMDVT